MVNYSRCTECTHLLDLHTSTSCTILKCQCNLKDQQKIDFIRQKCIEANPEIMELKFGCEVIFKKNDNAIGVFLYANDYYHFRVYERRAVARIFEEDYLEQIKKGNMVKIGRPIRLADVFKALNLGQFDDSKALEVEQTRCHALLLMWNPLDDLSKQDHVTIGFIYKLLNPL